jgi:hypothetical protein
VFLKYYKRYKRCKLELAAIHNQFKHSKAAAAAAATKLNPVTSKRSPKHEHK